MAQEENEVPEVIDFGDFARVELVVADVLEAEAHPNADRLLKLKINVGDEQRQICAGIRGHYEPEELVGRQVVVVKNLAPRKLRGEVSQGMLLAAVNEGKVVLLRPDSPLAAGSRVS